MELERFLIALDGTPESLKTVHYVNRVLKAGSFPELVLFHVLPTTSPDLLKLEELQHIERVHHERPHLRGYFWAAVDESKMAAAFEEARHLLLQAGVQESQIRAEFNVQWDDISQIILQEAKRLKCSTVVLGRRGLSRVKELLLGSVSRAVTRNARGITVWVVDD